MSNNAFPSSFALTDAVASAIVIKAASRLGFNLGLDSPAMPSLASFAALLATGNETLVADKIGVCPIPSAAIDEFDLWKDVWALRYLGFYLELKKLRIGAARESEAVSILALIGRASRLVNEESVRRDAGS